MVTLWLRFNISFCLLWPVLTYERFGTGFFLLHRYFSRFFLLKCRYRPVFYRCGLLQQHACTCQVQGVHWFDDVRFLHFKHSQEFSQEAHDIDLNVTHDLNNNKTQERQKPSEFCESNMFLLWVSPVMWAGHTVGPPALGGSSLADGQHKTL